MVLRLAWCDFGLWKGLNRLKIGHLFLFRVMYQRSVTRTTFTFPQIFHFQTLRKGGIDILWLLKPIILETGCNGCFSSWQKISDKYFFIKRCPLWFRFWFFTFQKDAPGFCSCFLEVNSKSDGDVADAKPAASLPSLQADPPPPSTPPFCSCLPSSLSSSHLEHSTRGGSHSWARLVASFSYFYTSIWC